MNRAGTHRFFISHALVLTGILLGGAWSSIDANADDPNAPGAPSPLEPLLAALAPDSSPSGVTFFTKKTRLWLGRSQIISFYSKDTLDEDRFFSFDADENFLHVLIPPTLVPGAHIGYIRMRPLKEGHTQIQLEGNVMDVEIVKDTAASTIELTRPEIVTPAEGAVVWGKFVVGVERINFSTSPPPLAPVLRLPNGQEIQAQEIPNQQPGPHLRYAFTIDAKTLRPGSNELVAVFKEDSGQEIASEPVDVVALEPDPSAIQAGDCKDTIQTQLPAPKIAPTGTPKVFTPPALITDDKSVYGQIVNNPGENPPWCMSVNIPAKGLYQMVMTARGDFGGNALPTLALVVDNEQNPSTTSRLATSDWQRTPVGHPVTLEAGTHVLAVRFRNGFGGPGQNDSRHLYLARYELARLDQLPAPAIASADPAVGTMQDPSATPFNQKPPPGLQPDAAAKVADNMMAQDPTMMQGKPAQDAMMEALLPVGSFHLVFRDALEGQVIANQAQINGLAWWPDRDHTRPPTVDLLVNDKVVASLTTAQPHFKIDVAAFQPGKNKVQLRGVLPDGRQAQSVAENITLPPELKVGAAPYRPIYRFHVYDPAWEANMKGRINTGDPDPIAAFYVNGDATLKLADSLQGLYKISIDARGTDFQGPAVATLVLKVHGQETKLGEVPVKTNLSYLVVGQTTFPAGPKELIVRYANDAAEPGKGDRNLFVHAVTLEPLDSHPEKIPLIASIAYPATNAQVGLADAVVANVSSNHGQVHADLLVDGQPQHLDLSPTNGFGPVLFPLLTRALSPGNHELQITARDDAGNTGKSPPVTVVVTGKDTIANGAYDHALLLLNRFGYGPETPELAAILTMGPTAWLQSRLYETTDSPSERNEQERLHAEFPDLNAVVPRALQYLITDPNPVRARFLVWAENHFSTWANKDGPAEKSREHDRFAELGLAPFPDLLLASATSPAMLIYLDQRNSVSKHLNENYAREIMELHTLGVKGGYTQRDVTTLADLLTGWTLG